MKTIIGVGVCFFSLLGFAAAQSDTIVKFNLSSAAMIGSTSLPAGSYTVREVSSSAGSAVLDFQGPNGLNRNVLAMETTEASDSASSTHVELKSDGERLHLDKIVIEGREFGFRVVQ